MFAKDLAGKDEAGIRKSEKKAAKYLVKENSGKIFNEFRMSTQYPSYAPSNRLPTHVPRRSQVYTQDLRLVALATDTEISPKFHALPIQVVNFWNSLT